jgi:hypothetical protein
MSFCDACPILEGDYAFWDSFLMFFLFGGVPLQVP